MQGPVHHVAARPQASESTSAPVSPRRPAGQGQPGTDTWPQPTGLPDSRPGTAPPLTVLQPQGLSTWGPLPLQASWAEEHALQQLQAEQVMSQQQTLWLLIPTLLPVLAWHPLSASEALLICVLDDAGQTCCFRL